MRLDARELVLLRLVAQRLAGPRPGSPADVAGWLTGMQAQDRLGLLTSLALRTSAGTLDGARAAFDAGGVVVSWPLRGTLHAVPAADLAWMLELTGPRARVSAVRRQAELGLDGAALDRARGVARSRLGDGQAVARHDLLRALTDCGLDVVGQRGYHLVVALALEGLLCSGPWRGGEHLLVAGDGWVREPRRLDREEALGELAERYFRSHGPALPADLARWTGLPAADVRLAVALARPRLAVLDVGGVEHLLDPAVPDLLAASRQEAAGAHLLPGFDELVLGYPLRGNPAVAADVADRVVPGGNGVFRPTALHDGQVVGTWSRDRDGAVHVAPFAPLEPGVVAALRQAAERLPGPLS